MRRKRGSFWLRFDSYIVLPLEPRSFFISGPAARRALAAEMLSLPKMSLTDHSTANRAGVMRGPSTHPALTKDFHGFHMFLDDYKCSCGTIRLGNTRIDRDNI